MNRELASVGLSQEHAFRKSEMPLPGPIPRREFLSALLLAPAALRAQEPAPLLRLTREEQEKFLQTANITKLTTLSEGITNSHRATLSDGVLTHDAHVQTIDERKDVQTTAAGTYPNFADSYKHNIAAYLLDKLLNIGMIPATVGRKVQGENASVTWWVDDVLMTEKQRYLRKVSPPDGKAWNRQIYCVRTFDELIYNFDRNLGNLVITKTWRLWMIDHTRSFLPYPKPKNEKRLIECDRHLLEAMRGLTREAAKALEPHLGVLRVDGLLSRRDRIVEYFEKEIARRGEEKVLFTILPFDTVVNLPESGGV
jgi:hypothetical protein